MLGEGGGSPEEPGVLHVLGIIVIRLLYPDAYPEEVFRLLTFIDDLWEKGWSSSEDLSAPAYHPAHCAPWSPACCTKCQTWC